MNHNRLLSSLLAIVAAILSTYLSWVILVMLFSSVLVPLLDPHPSDPDPIALPYGWLQFGVFQLIAALIGGTVASCVYRSGSWRFTLILGIIFGVGIHLSIRSFHPTISEFAYKVVFGAIASAGYYIGQRILGTRNRSTLT